MSKKLPISVVMIARNEAKRLPQSLGSVDGWVSEIIVVVNDCTDDTEEVARSFGAKVSEHPFQNLRDQKTVVLNKATQLWVLSLDADEVVSSELKEEIHCFFKNLPDDVNGVWFSRRLWFMNRWLRHGDTYPDCVLRLFRNGKGVLGGTEEHDRFEVDGKTIHFKNDLLHYSHESIANHVGKINFFSDFFLKRAVQNDKKASALQAIIRAIWRFYRAYLLRLGILDGFPGFYMAYFAAFATFVKYAKLYEHTVEKQENQKEEISGEDKINVIMAPDNAYAVHAGVVMISALRHAKNPERLYFYLLQDEQGISAENMRNLHEIAREYKAGLDVVTVNSGILREMNCAVAANYLPSSTFYRMLIPQLLPQLERCIYLDCDVVVLDDLALLWQEDISNVALGAVRDWHVEGRGLTKYDQIKYYFNAGVMYMNLKQWRKGDDIKECFRLAAIPEITERYSDQDVLNLVFSKNLLLLHPRWNIQTGQALLCRLHSKTHGNSAWKEVRKHPGIAHYSGRKRKPWYFDMKHDNAMAYWENFKYTPWGKHQGELDGLFSKALRKNSIARLRDISRLCLTIKITPRRGVYRFILFGLILINIMPKNKRHA